MKVAIDASRNRSGGARAHLIGVLSEGNPTLYGINEVHVWSYKALLDTLPNRPWLRKHCHPLLEKGLLFQLYWQKFVLARELRKSGFHALLSTDAGTVCRYKPSVVMSRDMLSFEPGEIDRFKWSVAWLRLIALRYMQVMSLRSATGQLFLTEYAATVIGQYLGRFGTRKVIPHGISDNFRSGPKFSAFVGSKPIQCICVSNADLYKHQWVVIEAVSRLKRDGLNISLKLLGGGDGRPAALAKIKKAIKCYDPGEEFVKLYGAASHADIPKHLNNSDIFIFSSSCENMPNTLLEGMASGLPILCSNRGPMPEILQDGGLLFDPENVDSLEVALRELIGSAETRNFLASRSREISDNYSWRRCARETWEYLSEISASYKG